MKKLILLSSFFLFFVPVLLAVKTDPVFAYMPQYETDLIYSPQDPTILGQNNYYSIFFRGNGEAIVNFKVQYTNNTDSPISSVSYIMPNASSVNNVVVYQISTGIPGPCYPPIFKPEPLGIDFESNLKIPSILPTPTPYIQETQELNIMPCLDRPYYYGGYGNVYHKADHELNGNTLLITLPRPIPVSQTVNLFLSYRSFDYVKKNLYGTFNYSFDTLQSEQTIDSIQIGIATEQDYILKDAKGQVNYNVRESVITVPPAADAKTGMYNQELDNYYNRIGQGTVYKYASHLAPMESYTVKGAYAESTWQLYVPQMISGVLIIIVVCLILLLLIRRLWRMAHLKTGITSSTKSSLWKGLTANQRALFTSAGISLAGSTLAVLYTLFLYYFMTAIMPYFSYQYNFEPVFMLLIAVFSFSVYAALLFLPAFVLALKKSIIWGVTTFIFTVIWLFLYLMIVSVLVLTLFRRDPVYPQPLMRQETEKLERVTPQDNL